MLTEEMTLLLLEYQSQILGSSKTVSGEELRRRAGLTLHAAEALHMRTMMSIVPLAPDQAPSLVEGLVSVEPFVRGTMSALDDPAIQERLAVTHCKTIAVGGVSSEVAVLQTVLQARRQQFEVHVLMDLCGGLSERTEATAVQQMVAAGAIISNVSSFLSSFAPNLSSPEGQIAMATMAQLWGW